MAITVSIKSMIVDNNVTTDAAIATALNLGTVFTSIYGVTVVPISNTQSRIIIVYA